MTYPIILRKKVLKSIDQVMSIRTAIKLYDLSLATITNWKKDVSIKPIIRLPRKIFNATLKQDVTDYLDAYYYERATRLGCSKSGIKVAMKRLGYTCKKSYIP
ncbi:IS630 transposase-related protein [Psychrobacter sp. AOP7-B1-24]|uniref:IS630 transposase-related protein n=1 Tax=Psychrobacter sp. AOP7-B1-24 TaxID=3457645 RepID=UPI00402BC918